MTKNGKKQGGIILKKYNKIIGLLLAVALMLPGMATKVSAAETDVSRLEGKGRIETSIEVSKKAYTASVSSVVLAGYDGEADALTGTLLASAKNAPLLLTQKDKLTVELKAELARLKPTTVYLLGGESAINKTVAEELTTLGYTVERVSGLTREETAVKVAEKSGVQTKNVFLAKGWVTLADALAIGPASAVNKMPVLLTEADKVSDATLASMKDLGVEKVTIVGGASAVKETVVTQLKALGYTVERVAEGKDRQDTALMIATKYFANSTMAVVASGYDSPDALVGGYFGAKMNAPIILTNKTAVKAETLTYLEKFSKAYVLGGPSAVDAKVFTDVETAVVGQELTVTSVSAINSKEVEVIFNKEVKEVKPVNFKVTDKDNSLLFVSKVELNKDKKTATLSFFDAFADKAVYTVVTSNVEDLEGKKMMISTNTFGYEKSDVAKVEFTTNIIPEIDGDLANIVKVTDKLGRNITKEVELEFASANTTIIANNGKAQSSSDGKEVLVTVTVKDTTVTAKKVIKVSQSSAKTFVGYTVDTTLAVNTDDFSKLDANKVFDFVSVSDKDNTGNSGSDDRKTLGVYALNQYGKSIAVITNFESVNNLTPNIVIVSAVNGKVTPVSEGTGFVKVKVGAVEQTLKINVRAEAKIRDIEVDSVSLNIVEKGLDGNLKLTYKDQFGGNTPADITKLTVKSSDTAVATVSKDDANNLTVKGLKKGTSNVTLTYKYKVGTEDVVIEKVVLITVSEKGSFADYKVEVSRTKLYSKDDVKTTTINETNVDIKVYELDDKGQKIAVATGTSLQARDKDAAGKEIDVIDDAAGNKVTISGLNVAFKAAGTQKVQVKVGTVVLETLEFTTVNNTPGLADKVSFDSVAIVVGEFDAADAKAKEINEQLSKIITIKDKFGDNVVVDLSADKIEFEYIITNKDGVSFVGTAGSAEIVDKVIKQNASADIVVTSIKYDKGKTGTFTSNLLNAPQVVKLSIKDTTKPLLTSGIIARSSIEEGTVKFTSSQTGEYYFAIVDKGASVPVIPTTATGIVVTKNVETIISLTGLTTGAKDIYVVVKDTAGNKSVTLKVELPAES